MWEFHGVHRAVGRPGTVLDDFEDSGTLKPSHHPRRDMPFAALREVQSVPKEPAHQHWKRHQVPLGAPDPDYGLLLSMDSGHYI